MNSYGDHQEYHYRKSPEKKRSYFVPYLLMLGVILGVLLTNTYRNKRDESRNLRPESPANSTVQQASLLSESEALTLHEAAVISATTTATSAVVSIYSEGIQIQRFRNNPIYDMLYGGTPRRKSAMGSGVIIHPEGIIITNSHVIGPATGAVGESAKIMVELPDGREYEAEVKYDFPAKDVAILSVKGTDPPLSRARLIGGPLPGADGARNRQSVRLQPWRRTDGHQGHHLRHEPSPPAKRELLLEHAPDRRFHQCRQFRRRACQPVGKTCRRQHRDL